MRFDLVDLRLFDAVVRAGSISKGAEAAHMALASASARISGMEDMLGVALLQRGRRGVTPTAAGLALLSHARSINGQVERMRGDLRLFSSGFKGEIKMLSNTAALVDIVPRALRLFLAANPGVDIDIEERTSAEIAMEVAAGRVEFGVVAAGAHTGALEVRPLAIDRLTVVVARSHPLAAREEMSFAELLDHPFVGLSAGALHDHLAQQAARAGRRIGYRVRLRSFDAVARLIEAGVGVGVLPLAAITRYRTPALTPIRLADDWANRRLLLCARSFAGLSLHARLFADEIERQSTAERPHAAPGRSSGS